LRSLAMRHRKFSSSNSGLDDGDNSNPHLKSIRGTLIALNGHLINSRFWILDWWTQTLKEF
ncbi:MAG: hypothetical protein ACFE0J_05545, partial [Elainellaceae cyanobacterium]